MRRLIALSAALVLVGCSAGDPDDTESTDGPDVVAVYEETGQSDGAAAQFGGLLLVMGGCLQLDDGTGYRMVPAFSSAGEPMWDGEVLTFDGRDYDTESEMGFRGVLLDEAVEVDLTVPDGCPDDLDIVLVHATHD